MNLLEEYLQQKNPEAILSPLYEAMMGELRGELGFEGIHVTDLIYDCYRLAWYRFHSKEVHLSLNSIITMWIGKKIHELKFLKYHEIPLVWEDIHGTPDEYEDGIIVEKKTTGYMPEREALDHHVRQLNFYRPLLEHNGYPALRGVVLYIDVWKKTCKPFDVRFAQPLEEIENDMRERKKRLQSYIPLETPPPRFISWRCGYCAYAGMCFTPPKPQ